MMKELKLSFQMMKYAFGVKGNIVACVITLLCGCFMEILQHGTEWLGGLFIILVSLYAVQFLYCISLSNMVSSSPYRKRFQTIMPAMVYFILSVIVFTLELVFRRVMMEMYPQDRTAILFSLLILVVYNFIIGIYTVFVFKFFYLSMVILIGFMVTTSFFAVMFRLVPYLIFEKLWFINENTIFVVVYLMLFVTAVVQYLLSLAMYKKPLSKSSQGVGLKKHL